MATDYSFIENELASIRRYQVQTEGYIDLIKTFLSFPQLKILSKRKIPFIEYTVDVSHLLDSPAKTEEIEHLSQTSGFDLPQDFIDFYKQWDGGFLLFRNPYNILSVSEILGHSASICNDVGKENTLTNRLLRFCDFGDGNYFALRRNDNGMTDVVFAYVADYDSDIISSTSDSIVLANNFSEWLKRIFESDGSPILRTEGYDMVWHLSTQADRIINS